MECVGSWINTKMDNIPVTFEDSYAERRQLFKNIWDTAINIDEQDADIMTKPKVIKTLRLDQVDRCAVNKKKKQKLRNLRTVCNKILDFCDKQDADDYFYEQMNAQSQGPTHEGQTAIKAKKQRNGKTKKKLKTLNGLYSPIKDPNQPRPRTSERKRRYNTTLANKTSQLKTPIQQSSIEKRNATVKTPKGLKNLETLLMKDNLFRSNTKKTTKKKKLSQPQLVRSSGTTGTTQYYYDIKDVTFGATKKQVQVHKINIT